MLGISGFAALFYCQLNYFYATIKVLYLIN